MAASRRSRRGLICGVDASHADDRARDRPVRTPLRRGQERTTALNEERLGLFLEAGFAQPEFDANDATEAGDIRAHLERLGQPIGPYDILIAAQARRRGATLVTMNRGEFDRVPGLDVTDWTG